MFFLFFFLFFCFFFWPISSRFGKNIAGKRFYYLLNFFTIFSRNFLSWVEYERNAGLKFCFPIFGLSYPVLAKKNAGKRFYNLLNFLLFLGNFLAGVECERRSGLKFCFLFFGLSPPVLAKINAGNKFYKFLSFFTIFFGIFLLGSSMNRIRD